MSAAGKAADKAAGKRALPVADGRRTWAWVRRELRARWRLLALTVAVGLVGAAASVVPVYALGALVDRVREHAPASALTAIAVVIAVAAVVGGAASGLGAYLVARLCGTALAGLRERAVARALTLPHAILDQAGRGDLLARTGADTAMIGKAVSDVIPTMVSAILLGTLSVAAMAGIDWRLGLAGAVAVPLYVVALRWYLPRAAPRYAEERAAVAASTQLLLENLQGVRTVRAYRMERRALRDIGAASGRVRDVSVSVFVLFTRFVGRINRAELCGLAAILVTGFFLVRAGAITVGQSAAAAILFHRLFNPIGMLLFTFDEAQAAGAGLARLVGLVELTPATAFPNNGKEPGDATLELTAIRFGYGDGGEVLRGVDLLIPAGGRVAVVGSTGAGKSTLAAIAAGILRPVSGVARVGGVPLADLDPVTLRRQVAIITQETHVFAGPLIEDLRLARPDATPQNAADALAVVGAWEWVCELPDGLDTAVGEGGHRLTAAQEQQVALARLVLADPAVAVLDEATAEVGSLGARELEKAALAATRGRTTLVVAHRLTQAATADLVVVLEHGEVVERGTHDELVAAGGRYAELWQAWQATPTLRR